MSQPYLCHLLHSWDFQEPILHHRVVPLTGPPAPWSRSVGLNFSHTGQCCSRAKGMGTHGDLALASQPGVRVCWEADGFLTGDLPTRGQSTEVTELCLVCKREAGAAPLHDGALPHHISPIHSFLRMSQQFQNGIFMWLNVPNLLQLVLCLYLPEPATRWNTFWSDTQTVTI